MSLFHKLHALESKVERSFQTAIERMLIFRAARTPSDPRCGFIHDASGLSGVTFDHVQSCYGSSLPCRTSLSLKLVTSTTSVSPSSAAEVPSRYRRGWRRIGPCRLSDGVGKTHRPSGCTSKSERSEMETGM